MRSRRRQANKKHTMSRDKNKNWKSFVWKEELITLIVKHTVYIRGGCCLPNLFAAATIFRMYQVEISGLSRFNWKPLSNKMPKAKSEKSMAEHGKNAEN